MFLVEKAINDRNIISYETHNWVVSGGRILAC
jgi:hypothetical protein